jgi:putative ABC transport system permease protein
MKEKSPPAWVLQLLQFACKDRYIEQIEGDLYELFNREQSLRFAKIKFTWNAMRFFRLRYLKGLDDYQQLTTLAMIKNYLKVAIRTLLKQKSYATINTLGLAIGLASCLLIVMYISNERSYDNFYPDIDKMYRVANGEKGRHTPSLLASTMMRDYPQVEVATKISGLHEAHIQMKNETFVQEGGCWADENVFEVFEMEFVLGNKDEALSKPDNMVLTESLAKKYFPSEPAMEQTMEIDGDLYTVTGVVKDPPRNTHFPFKFIVADPINPNDEYNWTGNNYWTYAKIQQGVSVEEMNEHLQQLFAKYAGPEIISFSGHATFQDFLDEYADRYFGYTLHPVSDIHLYTPHFSMGARGDYKNVVIFSLVALFILLIACVNYINMSTARSAVRSKEVGIRKALGSQRKNIIYQFLTESTLITFLSLIFAVAISGAALDYFNVLTGREFTFSDLFALDSILAIIGLLLIVGLLAGAYPAYIISSFSPIKALRGQMQQAGKRGLRNGLVAFQFAISIFLVAATVVIYSQVRYMQSQELGVNIEQTLVINNGSEIGDKYELFKTMLEQRTDVENVAKASNGRINYLTKTTYGQIPITHLWSRELKRYWIWKLQKEGFLNPIEPQILLVL